MRVFISSRVQGMEPFRDAAAKAICTLGDEPVRSEDFASSPSSPQAACLAGVREADAVVLILGADYGSLQESGLSPTHEEYRAARESRPVLAFVQDDVAPAREQAELIAEVQGWEGGHYTSPFRDADDLCAKVIRGLHDYLLDAAADSVDDNALVDEALSLVPDGRLVSNTMLVLAVTGGPSRQVLRPAELNNEELRRFLKHEALTGDDPVLDLSVGTDCSTRGATIVLEQRDTGSSVTLSETGSVVVVQPVVNEDALWDSVLLIIEEDLIERLTRIVRFVGSVLNHVDQQRRISYIAPAAALLNAGVRSWRTREQHALHRNSGPMNLYGQDRLVATLTPATRRRPALVHESRQLAEDLTVHLRRAAEPNR